MAGVVDLALEAAPAAVAARPEDGDMYFTLATAILCATIVLWYGLTFNALVKARNAVDQSWSHIEVELKRRFDLIQNLVEIVKGYARHESETFQAVASLRSQSQPFGDAGSANQVQPELSRTISQIQIFAEHYPQLRADQSFLNLQTELAETENRIAERRHAYNQTVNRYLNLLQSFPSNLVAEIQSMAPRSFFEVTDEIVAEAPRVELS